MNYYLVYHNSPFFGWRACGLLVKFRYVSEFCDERFVKNILTHHNVVMTTMVLGLVCSNNIAIN